jgi:hypothetical protein
MYLNLNKKVFIRVLIVSVYSLLVLYLFGMMRDFTLNGKVNLWVLVPAYIFFFNVASEGNLLIDKYLNKRLPWFIYTRKRLVIQIVATLGWTFLMTAIPFSTRFLVNSVLLFHDNGLPRIFPAFVMFTYVEGTFFLVAFNGIYIARNFFHKWKSSLLEIEKLKQEKLKRDYQALQDQINPHFLFNSLNVLISEIYHHPETAADFARGLSRIYRYVLQSKDRELVPLKTELEFVQSFIYLHQARVGEALQVEIDVDEQAATLFLPPLTLQVLVENAIKHNVLEKDNPLQISIYSQIKPVLTVKNNFNPKMALESPHTGLSNLKSRYALLGNRSIEVYKNEKEFVVEVPLLEN